MVLINKDQLIFLVKVFSKSCECRTLFENRKREDIKCVKKERVNVFPNAR